VFSGVNQGLIVAEIELTSEAEPFDRPDWLGDEVSGDVRYDNACLVNRPFSIW
jgi:adenylate cyclase